ncbi:MAG: L-seryl-tRNA(Sec) selenium transferase [Syntrophales bacterium]
MDEAVKKRLKTIPKMDDVLLILKERGIMKNVDKEIVKKASRRTIEDIRSAIRAGRKAPLTPEEVADKVVGTLFNLGEYRLRPVINATGVILHTNLGRAPLCREALDRVMAVSRGYSNLEFDLKGGQRGSRYDHLREVLLELTGAEDAIVVNNNAAAVLLALNSLSEGKEAVVSRGELIEIGGEFRLPEIMEKSGAILREVGTTNKTYLADYESAVSEFTGLLMKVHPSNYRISGFTSEVQLPDLAALGRRCGIPVLNDLGSGCFLDLDRYGLDREPTVREVVADGADVVTFSGDKLLGGPQAGVILGKKEFLERIRKNPLNRALRIGKMTLAALEATLMLYLKPETAVKGLRILRSMTEDVPSVERRAKLLFDSLSSIPDSGLHLSLIKGVSMAGGGSLPGSDIPSVLIAVRSSRISASRIESRLRSLEMPVVARIAGEEVLFDLRTITEEEIPEIKKGLEAALAKESRQ